MFTATKKCPDGMVQIPGMTTCIDKAGKTAESGSCGDVQLCEDRQAECKKAGGDWCTKAEALAAFAKHSELGLTIPSRTQFMPTKDRNDAGDHWLMRNWGSYGAYDKGGVVLLR